MKTYPTSDIRNVALIGHGGSGKTSLASALLFASGSVKRLGAVDDGSAITDFEDEEIARKLSIQTAVAWLEWKGRKINVIDTPGYAAFVADAQAALRACDLALLVVEAVSGVQVVTERTFQWAADLGLPLMFVINRLDRENASFERGVASIQERFGRSALPVQIPIGAEHGFEGVVDVLGNQAYRFARDRSGKMSQEPVPTELAGREAEAHAALVEMVAETDDTLLESFFEGGDLSAEQSIAGLHNAIRQRKLFPIFGASALQMIGVQPLLDAILALAPAPNERGDVVGTHPASNEPVSRAVSATEPVSAFVFKTVADPFAGRLSFLRVCSGVLRPDSAVINPRRGGHSERLAGLAVAQGKQTTPIGELHAGDLGIVAKLKETQTCDTLCDATHPIVYPPVAFPEPAISYAVEPKSKGDEEKISTALARLLEEDPVLRVRRDERTGELLVSGTGQVHVEVALARMKRKFGVEALVHPPRVPYLETVKRRVEHVEGKHKKQTGGRGQFGVCVIHLEPLPHGTGFEFVDKIFGGAIPQNYRPAVEKGIREAATHGWLAGHPVVDFRVTLVDGKYHDVDSSEMAFKIAGSLAFKEAMAKALPTILEPVMNVEITAPEEYMGAIMGDLSSRRGKPQGMDGAGPYQVIRAQVPMSEMLDYASTLKSITSDRASYTMEFNHYEEAPAHVREKIVAEHARHRAEKAD